MEKLKVIKKMFLDLNGRRNLLEKKVEKYREVNVSYTDEMKEILELGNKIILLKEIEYRFLKGQDIEKTIKSLLSEYLKKVNDNEMVEINQMRINSLAELKYELDRNLREVE